MRAVFSARVLDKYEVQYGYCAACGLLKTETPYWLAEAYREAISDTDVGLVGRNLGNSAALEVILECLALGNGRFLDVAGGYGLLTRLMRDKGYDCYTTDKCCPNVFAKTFEPGPGFKATALFAFEVLEHIEDPLQFLGDLFERYGCRTVILSTLTFDNAIPPTDWWYYGFESGQHITFYQPRTLAALAGRLGCRYYGITPSLHIITDRNITGARRLLLFNKYLRKLYAVYLRRKRRGLSKTWDDRLQMKAHLKAGGSARPEAP
jgi:hypothetical protein